MDEMELTNEDFLEIVDVFRTLAQWDEEHVDVSAEVATQSVHVRQDLRYAH
jgi:Asp-tRNA(Asn)/Glu-tRNA(Gln) amidotransferase C subunit